ncbi:MAG: LCP family protein [Chloroflexi bacterium]|nr:LCP family protein [Chloroflexota bacterium]
MTRNLFLCLLAYLCLALGLYAGAFYVTRAVVACWQLTSIPGVPPSECRAPARASFEPTVVSETQTPAAPASPEIPSPELDLPQWDGGSRINIAFFGLRGGDFRDEGCPVCTDTIILLTVDPVSKTAGMLSIPRDLWADIPGFGHSRINTAWTLGEAAKLPGGGPGLAMETVSQLIGVPVHYYVQVDFGTFVSFINLIGGIDIYVEQRMVLDPTGSGQDHFVLKPGDIRHLTGKRALAYARCRSESQGCSDGDVGRARRQQQVILAIRDKVFDPMAFPNLLAQAPALFAEFSSGVRTNLSLEDAIKLAVLARDIPLENIKQGVMDNNMALFANTALGGAPASVLRPAPDMIRVLRNEIFTADGTISPLAQGDLAALMQSEAARVRVINNTYTDGLAKRTAAFLQAKGLQVAEIGAPTGDATQTVLILYSPKLYTLKYLTELLSLTSYQIVMKPDSTSTVDIEIRLGDDWVEKLPQGH